MKVQGSDFCDIPQAVCLPQQSAQVLSEYLLAGMPGPPKARLLRSVFRTLTTFEALESSQSSRQISGGLGPRNSAQSDTASLRAAGLHLWMAMDEAGLVIGFVITQR